MHFLFPRVVHRHPRIHIGLILLLAAGPAHAAQSPLISLEQSGTAAFVAAYVNGCIAAAVSSGDCGPVWQLGIIAALLVVSIVTLALLRLSAYRSASRAIFRAESKS
jgi:hypothetical protein